MRAFSLNCLLAVLLGLSTTSAIAQAVPDNASVASQPILDAAGPKQRIAINAVYLISCAKSNMAGTGFLASNGLIVTNHHVIKGCQAGDLLVISSSDKHITVSQLVSDEDRDLALLKPSATLTGGLELASSKQPLPGTEVSTWGYPFLYNGYYPLLSVGYVAGYRDAQNSTQTKTVKRIVVNGAFNHGNSGGPLLMAQDNKVIGVVVATYHFFPEYVNDTIKILQEPHGGYGSGRFSMTDAHGQKTGLMDEQVIGMMLAQFYEKTQVMIGEAISVSELQTFIGEKSRELGLPIAGAHPKSDAK